MNAIKFLLIIAIVFSHGYSYGQNNVQYVDLGLPSGTLWADRNVGASAPEGIGDYFAWGEISPKKKYSWSTYKFGVGKAMSKNQKTTKYISDKSLASAYQIDENSVLQPEDDAATQNIGDNWRIPTYSEMYELLYKCKWEWTSRNGLEGCNIIGPNGSSIFIPAAGHISDKLLQQYKIELPVSKCYGEKGLAWFAIVSCTKTATKEGWQLLGINKEYTYELRHIGRNVRAVYKKDQIAGKPQINYINFKAISNVKNVSLQAGIKSSTKISNIEFSINGQVERGINVVNSNEYDAEFKKDIMLNEGTNTIKLSVTNAAGTVEDVRTITYTPMSTLKPQIIWNDTTTISKSKTYNLDVSVKSSSKIEYANVYVNGQLERGIVVSPTTIGDMDIKRTIILKEGQNSIKIEVKNIDGVSVIERTITYTSQSLQPVTITQKRLALVIGNSNYSSATKLPNPINDATDVASKLRALGFEVVEKHDLTIKTFKSAIRDFGARASLYDASIVYYAGHAIERNGKNYLIPVDAVIEVASDIEDECVRADYIIDNLEEAKSKMNIIVLDACRNNPINRSWARSLSGGLSSMTAPTGTFIAFSTAPGHTAADGEGRNSPFTEAFLICLDKPNLPLELFFKEVLRDVSTKTSNRQIPWTQSSFIGDFYFNIK